MYKIITEILTRERSNKMNKNKMSIGKANNQFKSIYQFDYVYKLYIENYTSQF